MVKEQHLLIMSGAALFCIFTISPQKLGAVKNNEVAPIKTWC